MKGSCLLAGRGVRAIGNGDEVLRGLMRVAGLLGVDNNAAVLSGLDANGLMLEG